MKHPKAPDRSYSFPSKPFTHLFVMLMLAFVGLSNANAQENEPNCGANYDHRPALEMGNEYRAALKARDYERLKELREQRKQQDLWAKTKITCSEGQTNSDEGQGSDSNGGSTQGAGTGGGNSNDSGSGSNSGSNDTETDSCSADDQSSISNLNITANGQTTELLIPIIGLSPAGKAEVSFASTFDANNCQNQSYEWDFGDGTTSTATSPNKTYTQPGDYKVTLTLSCESATCETTSEQAEFNVIVFTVELITPKGDPVTKPVDSGDGQNEFTFNTAAPGVLTVDFKAKVVPASVPLDKVKDLVSFTLEKVGTLPTWNAANPAGKASISGAYLVAKAQVKGLPTKNGDFGKKEAKLLLDGQLVETVEIEVFFDKLATNNPTSDPNWFYYWKEGNVCGIPASAVYDSTASFGYVRPGVDNILRLGVDAPTTNTGPEVYTHKTTGGTITVTGVGKGIASVAETVEHELYHLTIYNTSARRTDNDSDGVANVIEPTLTGLSTLVNDGDTYGMASFNPGYISYGDNEVRARKKETDYSVKSYPKLDWANPGSQSKSQFGPKP